MANERLNIGEYRPIYLWGGPGTIRMNRVKFMNQAVDEFAHHEAHAVSGAERIVNTVYSNWVHLMYDWGFPPEIEAEDFDSFAAGASVYHDLGVKVFAYIQTSNCVYMGSYLDKDWYARDAKGRKIYYYTQRYMVDLLNLAWQEHLKEMIRGAIEQGADGIFFDNLWFGAMPLSMMGAWLGEAGCFTPLNQQLYREETGNEIPRDVNFDTAEVRFFLQWRAAKLTEVLADLAAYARSIKSDVLIGANDFDIVMRSANLIYGMDLRQLAEVQDVTMIENYAIPKWVGHGKQKLVNNALTIRVAREWVKEKAHLSVLSYDDGIGWDGMYPTRRFLQTMAEAAACGVSNTIKGTEYYHDGKHTVLSAAVFQKEQEVIGLFQRWLEQQGDRFGQHGKNCAKIVLSIPNDGLVYRWHQTAGMFFGVAQTLTMCGLPWRCADMISDAQDAAVVFGFTSECRLKFKGHGAYQYIHVPDLPGWNALSKKSLVKQISWMRGIVQAVVEPLWHSYFSSKLMRTIIDGLRLFRLFTGTPYFDLPNQKLQQTLNSSFSMGLPKVSSAAPVLIECWERNGKQQIHLVNYADTSQRITVHFSRVVSGSMVNFAARHTDANDDTLEVQGKDILIDLDLYAIVEIDPAKEE